MNLSQLKAFTLVELIVVITIVGILSTVGFVSYSGYLAGARDSNRFSQLTKLSDSLQVYAATKSLPLPDDYIEISASGAVIGYQGYVGVDVLETIDYTNGGKDPKDGSYYTYYLSKNRKNMQLLAFMEEQSSVSFSSQSYAVDYTERVPKVYGKKLGVLIELGTNTPVQEVSGLTALDIVNTTENYVAYLTSTDTLEGDGTSLKILAAITKTGGKILKDCKSLLADNSALKNQDGTYLLNIHGTKIEGVYCDMTTDGGGWTFATLSSDASYHDNIFYSDNTSKVTDINETGQSSKGQLDDIWNEQTNKDVMIMCRTSNVGLKNYEKGTVFLDIPYSRVSELISSDWTGLDLLGGSVWKACGETGIIKSDGFASTSGSPHRGYIKDDTTDYMIMEIYENVGMWGGKTSNSLGCRSGITPSNSNYNAFNYCMTAIR